MVINPMAQAFNNLFLIMHNIKPDINTQNFDTTSRQVQLLIEIAKAYECLPMIRFTVIASLLEYGKIFFRAIMKDPIHWLNLSCLLESTSIFQEAMVHIVGQYPHWLKKSMGVKGLPEQIIKLIRRKRNEIRERKTDIEEVLLDGTVTVDGCRIKISRENKDDWSTWFVVQYWRDWFLDLRATSKSPQNYISGTVYRTMAKGGDDYLSASYIHGLLKDNNSAINVPDYEIVATELAIMTDFAMQQVQPLVVNNSMLCVEEESIDYLTCASVEKNEFPWAVPDN
jgi:hypothetical protein